MKRHAIVFAVAAALWGGMALIGCDNQRRDEPPQTRRSSTGIQSERDAAAQDAASRQRNPGSTGGTSR